MMQHSEYHIGQALLTVYTRENLLWQIQAVLKILVASTHVNDSTVN